MGATGAFLFVRLPHLVRQIYLSAGRRWLAWTFTGMRACLLLLTFGAGISRPVQPRAEFATHTVSGRVRHGSWRGFESVGAAVRPARCLPDRPLHRRCERTAWRRGDRRKALMVGGSVVFFIRGRARHVVTGVVGKHPGADCREPLLSRPGGGHGVRVEPRRAARVATRPRTANQRVGTAGERGAHEPGRRDRRLWHLDSRSQARRGVGE